MEDLDVSACRVKESNLPRFSLGFEGRYFVNSGSFSSCIGQFPKQSESPKDSLHVSKNLSNVC